MNRNWKKYNQTLVRRGEIMLSFDAIESKGFLKIHVAVDVKSKQITGLEITDDHSHNSKHFISLVEQSKQFGNVTKTLADGAYDTPDDFVYLYHEDITAGIKTRKNSSITTDCYARRKSVLA